MDNWARQVLCGLQTARQLTRVIPGMRLNASVLSALLIDSQTFSVWFSCDRQVAIPRKFMAVQSLQRVSATESRLNAEVPQFYVAIGCAAKSITINRVRLSAAIMLIDSVLEGESFAGLGHFERTEVIGFYGVDGNLFEEPGTWDYGRLFVGTPYSTIIRFAEQGFETLNSLGSWSPVRLEDVNLADMKHCWLIGRQDLNSPFAQHQAIVRVGGDGLWMDMLFQCEGEEVVVRGSSELLLDYGIYLGPIGNEKKPSVISVSYGELVTVAHIHTPKHVR